MKSICIFCITLFMVTTSFSQQKDTLSIEGKFNLIYNTSSSYKEFKVIRKSRFKNLKDKVSDSIKVLNNALELKVEKINRLEQDLNSINKVLLQSIVEKTTALQTKNNMFFLGIALNKTSYKVIMWFIIIILSGILCYFIFKFKNSHQIIVSAKENLLEAENELVNFKKKSIENDQKLRRQLQDEINKQRGV